MNTPNNDPNTDGKGAEGTTPADAGQEGSDTSADNQEGGATAQPETTPPAPEETPTPTTPEVEDEDDDDDVDLIDDGEKKFTQTEVNQMISKRLKAAKRAMKTELSTKETGFNQTITNLTAELNAYRQAETATVKVQFDALPEEIRALAPSNLDSPEGVAAVKSWIPKVQTLAAKISGTPEKTEEKKTPTPGNSESPKPTSTAPAKADDADLIAKARKHTIYSSF